MTFDDFEIEYKAEASPWPNFIIVFTLNCGKCKLGDIKWLKTNIVQVKEMTCDINL